MDVGGSPLAFPTSATSVRIRDEKRVVTYGSFGETNGFLGGKFVIEVVQRNTARDQKKSAVQAAVRLFSLSFRGTAMVAIATGGLSYPVCSQIARRNLNMVLDRFLA